MWGMFFIVMGRMTVTAAQGLTPCIYVHVCVCVQYVYSTFYKLMRTNCLLESMTVLLLESMTVLYIVLFWYILWSCNCIAYSAAVLYFVWASFEPCVDTGIMISEAPFVWWAWLLVWELALGHYIIASSLSNNLLFKIPLQVNFSASVSVIGWDFLLL